VAKVCRESGLTDLLDARAPESSQQVSVGTATVAMVPGGLGFSNRQLYLVPQFFATKPMEMLLGQGVTAEALNDDCLGRTLDWIAAHDPTRLFAGIATQARRRFGIDRHFLHVRERFLTQRIPSQQWARTRAGDRMRSGRPAS